MPMCPPVGNGASRRAKWHRQVERLCAFFETLRFGVRRNDSTFSRPTLNRRIVPVCSSAGTSLTSSSFELREGFFSTFAVTPNR
jgi:hypothetical protein